MSRHQPLRGEVWITEFSPTKGRQRAGTRPALVLSVDAYNRSQSGLVTVVPITRTPPRVPWHVAMTAGEGGLDEVGAILCDHLRAISVDRLFTLKGSVSSPVLEEVQRLARYLLDL